MTTGRIDASMTNRMADTCTDAPKPLGEAAPDDVRAFESVLRRVGEEGARNGQNGPNDAPRSLLTENDPNRSLLSADDRERPNRANLSNLSTEKDPAGASLPSGAALPSPPFSARRPYHHKKFILGGRIMGFLKNLLGLGVAAGTAYAAVKVAQKYNESGSERRWRRGCQ